MTIRKYHHNDCQAIVDLFYNTVHYVNSNDYTEIQLSAWAPVSMDLPKWDNRLSTSYSVVVEEKGLVIGFGNVDDTGYLDLLYTHKDYQGIGVASLIVNNIESYIIDIGIHTITTAASVTAKHFFEKRGYVVLEKENVLSRGQYFINYKMQKNLCK